MLDFEDYMEIGRKHREFMDEIHGKKPGEEKKATTPPQQPQIYESNLGLILYIIVMIVGTVFYDRVLIWIAATIIYFSSKNKTYKK